MLDLTDVEVVYTPTLDGYLELMEQFTKEGYYWKKGYPVKTPPVGSTDTGWEEYRELTAICINNKYDMKRDKLNVFMTQGKNVRTVDSLRKKDTDLPFKNGQRFIVETVQEYKWLCERLEAAGYRWASQEKLTNYPYSYHEVSIMHIVDDKIWRSAGENLRKNNNSGYKVADLMKKGRTIMTDQLDTGYERLQAIHNIGSTNGTLIIWRNKATGMILMERGCSGKLTVDDFMKRVEDTHGHFNSDTTFELNKHGERYMQIIDAIKVLYPDYKPKELKGHIRLSFLKGTDEDQHVAENTGNGHIFLSNEEQGAGSNRTFTWTKAQSLAKKMYMSISKEDDKNKTALIWEPIY